MKRALLIALALAATPHAAQSDPGKAPELVVIVNADNDASPDARDLDALFRRDQQRWSGGEKVIPLNAAPDSAPRKRFDDIVLHMSADESARFWLDQRIRHGTSAPREVDAAQAVKMVARFKGAIAYVPADVKLTGVRVVARVRDKVEREDKR